MTEKLLTPSEAQQLLRISKSTLYRLVRSGELPAVRVGGVYRIPMSELEKYLTNTNYADNRSGGSLHADSW